MLIITKIQNLCGTSIDLSINNMPAKFEGSRPKGSMDHLLTMTNMPTEFKDPRPKLKPFSTTNQGA